LAADLKLSDRSAMPRAAATEFILATAGDAEAIAHLRNAAAADLTARYGRDWWSRGSTVKGATYEMRISKVYVHRSRGKPVATFRLATRKPWSINPAYFIPVKRVFYLHSLAVHPKLQGRGIGTKCLEAAARFAASGRAQAIRLDAFDHAAGARAFYRKGGFRECGRVTYRGVPLIYFERLL
jgi:ribosomal protein S18 acetylase RimI-like enzyme